MPVIGVVDDRVDVRAIVVDSLILSLPEVWEVVAIDPLMGLEDYPSWISAAKISVLVIDERLDEVAASPAGSVNYYGHDLVKYLRGRMQNFPIFVVTSYPNDEELRKRFSDVEDIIDRTTFGRTPDSYAARFARASQRYLEAFEHELADLSRIAVKAAAGQDISEEEQTRVQAIQQKINTAFAFEDIQNRSQWIDQMESTIKDFEHLQRELESLLERSGKNEMEEDS